MPSASPGPTAAADGPAGDSAGGQLETPCPARAARHGLRAGGTGAAPSPGCCSLPAQPGAPVSRSLGSCRAPCAAQRWQERLCGHPVPVGGHSLGGLEVPTCESCPGEMLGHGQTSWGGVCCDFRAGQIGVFVPWTWVPALPAQVLASCLGGAATCLPVFPWGHTHGSAAGPVPGGCGSWARPTHCSKAARVVLNARGEPPSSWGCVGMQLSRTPQHRSGGLPWAGLPRVPA